MALVKTKIPTVSTLKIKLDTKKREIELKGEKYKVTEDVTKVVELLMTEINVLTALFENMNEFSELGQS